MTAGLLAIGAVVAVLLGLALLVLLTAAVSLLHGASTELARHRIAVADVMRALVAVDVQLTRLATVLSGPVRVEFPAAASPSPIDRLPTAGRSPH